jgi:hypothetical protein
MIVADQRALFCAAWWRKLEGEVGEAERRGRGFYRCRLGSKWKGNEEELRGKEMLSCGDPAQKNLFRG